MKALSPVCLELIDFIVSPATPEALLEFRPSLENQRRVSELVEGQENGTLSRDEASELHDFVQIGHLTIMAKAEARFRLQLETIWHPFSAIARSPSIRTAV